MKASVQYDDLVGTSAADVSDVYKASLQNYLVGSYESYDGDRYVCCGCKVYVFGQDEKPSGNIAFICWDKVDKKYVSLNPLKDLTLDDIFALFKRFEVVIGNDMESIEVDSDDYLDLK